MTRRFQVVDERVNGNTAASRKACEASVDDQEPSRADRRRLTTGPATRHWKGWRTSTPSYIRPDSGPRTVAAQLAGAALQHGVPERDFESGVNVDGIKNVGTRRRVGRHDDQLGDVAPGETV